MYFDFGRNQGKNIIKVKIGACYYVLVRVSLR
jgi:hypothetical protein